MTPRGTTVKENPLKTLLDRNQTLVKEVRFADQTCVELSSKVSALEAQNQILQEQTTTLENENDDLHRELENNEEIYSSDLAAKKETVARLSEDLKRSHETIESIRATSIDEQTLRTIFDELGMDIGASKQREGDPLETSAFSVAANGSAASGEFDKSYTSYCLAKALQKQVKALKEKAKLVYQAEEMPHNSEEVESQEKPSFEEARTSREKEAATNFSDPEHPALEISRARSENDFLGRQLGSVQAKLDKALTCLEEENSRFEELEQEKKEEEAAHLQKVALLEDQLEKATGHLYLYKDGPTSPRLLDADKRVFTLEKELAHAKASIQAMKRESANMLSSPSIFCDDKPTTVEEKHVLVMMRASLSKMHENYQDLEEKVKKIVEAYTERLETLVNAIAYLRSSLLFEAESVSTQVQEECAQKMMNATIDSAHNSNREDELLDLMEEARSPPMMKRTDVEESSSDFGDISRLLPDDLTLESIVKGGSIGSAYSSAERWKEPLEAAIKECQRVRERSSKLKNEVEAHKSSIQLLHAENGRLSLNASRKVEEIALVKKALDESKERIDALQSSLNVAEDERNAADNNVRNLQTEKEMLEERSRNAEEHMAKVEESLQERKVDLDETKNQLKAAMESSEGYKTSCDDLLTQLEHKEAEITKRKDAEIGHTRHALQQAENDMEYLRRAHQNAMEKLSSESEAKSKYETKVADLKASQQQFFSDAEDRVLESQYRQEDMRKERADLKSKLNRKEQEVVAIKETFTGFKSRVTCELDNKRSLISSLQSERSELDLHMEQLAMASQELFGIFESAGFCTDLLRRSSYAKENPLVDDRKANHLGVLAQWKEIIPVLGQSMHLRCQEQRKAHELQLELDKLQEEFFRLHGLESDYQKQIQGEKEQNAKLFTLLSQAEMEMERSAKQIREMSSALSRLQQQEAEANEKAKALEGESIKAQKELERSQRDTIGERQNTQLRLSQLTETLRNKESQLSEATDQL
jgi:hypothetical protein